MLKVIANLILAQALPTLLVKEGQTLIDLNRIDEAVELMRPLTQNPDASPDINVIAGLLLAKAKKEDRAMAHYRAALRVDDNYAKAHLLLANALARKELFSKAAAHYERFLSLSEETPITPEIRKRLDICKSKMK